jgi:radical SAM protein with 4Fe4S-binding SPASM domain
MADEFRIDGHKLSYHVGRVSQWLGGHDIPPIYVEVSPSGACNHRCTYCALDYMGYEPRFLDHALLKERLAGMAAFGVKSVMFAGEGEPLLHREAPGIINGARASCLDVAVTTNGVLMDARFIEAALPSITWIKVSMNAGTRETYARIHRTREDDFERVVGNIRAAVALKASHRLDVAIGMQMILLPENAGEATTLARVAKDIGADYLVVKSYSQHLMSQTERYRDVRYGDYLHLKDELDALSDGRFSVVFRTRAMEKLDHARRGYERCLALPFWSYIDSGGKVWACSAYLSDPRFLIGDITHSTFEEVWKGERRRAVMEYVERDLDTSGCRVNCRMDEVNRYLHDLKNPPAHVNFI